MALKRISDLTAASLPLAGTEEVELDVGGVARKCTTQDIADLGGGGGGGMTNPMTTAGDLIYGGVAGAPTRLGIGSNGQVLTLVAGLPAWSAAGAGTVTSVAYSFNSTLSDVFGVSGSPVTTSGTITAAAVDPGADRLVFWDDSDSKLTYLTLGTNLSITGTTINASGGSGLTNWAEAVNTAAPNNGTTSAVSFTPVAAATNSDAIINPKGNAANLAQTPDNTTTGGNKRGQRATDWQKVRNAATQVANGDESVIGGGSRNTASAQQSVVGGGFTNTASNTYSGVLAGSNNTASGAASAVLGGSNNVAAGADSACLGGANNDSDGQYSTAMGFKAQCRGIIGAWARSCGGFNNIDGDGQDRQFYLAQTTSNATQATATTNRAAADTTNQIVLPNNSAFIVKGTINVRENATGDSSAWDFTAYIKRGANAASTAMVVACTPTLIGQDAGAATWVVTVDADTTNGSLRCRVTGEASHSLKWGWSIYSCNEVAG